MTTFAANTAVTSDKSRSEIERTLARYGAEDFAYATTRGQALVGFTAHGRQIRFTLVLPERTERRFTHTPTGRDRAKAAQEAEYEQAVRQKWRALALMVKAKLEAVESGIVEFEQEFLAHIVLPGSRNVWDETRAAIDMAYRTGQVQPLLQIEGPR